MFKDNFIRLCNENKVSPSKVCTSIGLSNAAFSCWTDTTVPRKATLIRIADYFGVSVDYLLGKGTNESAPISVSSTKSEKPSENGELPEKNVVTIIGRDGRYIQKKLTDEQIQALETIINQMPDAPDEI